MAALEAISKVPPALAALKASLPTGEVLAPHATFLPRPICGRLGLAAGMDKNARAVAAFAALGFAFVEIGTVTPRPQPGNDKPRLWRLTQTREIRNHMGFNNDGAQTVAERLRKLRSTKAGRRLVVGVNIGKNKVTPAERAHEDYFHCARQLAHYADFLVINVSSPNTARLRELQTVEALGPIVDATRQGAELAGDGRARGVPIFVKIAPDLANEDIAAIADLVNRKDLAGIVATNTTNQHDLGEGGVSGPRLLERAVEVVSLLRQQLDAGRTIIAAGGISTADDARRLLDAGADLLEALTAFIYEGGAWPSRINRSLR